MQKKQFGSQAAKVFFPAFYEIRKIQTRTQCAPRTVKYHQKQNKYRATAGAPENQKITEQPIVDRVKPAEREEKT